MSMTGWLSKDSRAVFFGCELTGKATVDGGWCWVWWLLLVGDPAMVVVIVTRILLSTVANVKTE